MGKGAMKKFLTKTGIGLFALLVGLVISLQVKNLDKESPEGLIPLSKVQVVASEYEKLQKEKEAASQELIGIEAQIKKIEEAQAEENALADRLVSDLEKYRMMAGIIDVEGPGIIVTISDPPAAEDDLSDYSVIMNRYDLLLILINKLNDAGAEAVSVNGQRITALTEMVPDYKNSAAVKSVYINGIPTVPPYVIKAIGNPEVLESNLTVKYGIADEMKNVFDLEVGIEKSDRIIINRYSGTIKFKYAVTAE